MNTYNINNNTVATLHKAKGAFDNDEYYTQYEDIENELKHYINHFNGAKVYCNCDSENSAFVKFFKDNSSKLNIKSLSFSCNDFRSDESIDKLKEADIVVTNPPFSLFREYVAQLMKYGKKFLIIGNQNALSYKEVFSLIKQNRLWLGYYSGNMSFKVPGYYEPKKTRFWVDQFGQKWRSLGNVCWFTNLETEKQHVFLKLEKKYNPIDYPKYDNYDAINVNKIADIPVDYEGEMGVPITFLNKYNPEQFEIIGAFNNSRIENKEKDGYVLSLNNSTVINGKEKLWNGPIVNKQRLYARIVIRKKIISK